MRSLGATVVIGANFGDEGKGLAVDALVAGMPDAVVVRHNGGAQAGHTVVPEHGRKHVFSHVGAGAFSGAATFLSRFFVVHPAILVRECAELANAGLRPKVFVDPDAQVTTPLDVLVNRWVEETRGGGRHGSVGVGFGETIERVECGYPLAVRDLGDDARVRENLAHIHKTWLPIRLRKLGVELTPKRQEAAADCRLVRGYLEAVRVFRRAVVPAPIDAVLARRSIVFEGAQGLLLDQNRGFKFPFVTRSNTGLANVIALASDAGIDHLDVLYMTRAYLTRHGAGPLPNEVTELSFADVVDPTNRPNPWQGSLRVAPLDLDLLRDTIAADISSAVDTGVAVAAGVGVTCVDQLRSHAEIRMSGRTTGLPSRRLAATIADAVGLPLVIDAHGPLRAAVRIRNRLIRGADAARARVDRGGGRASP
jgi:adenylosuccinate synthase